MAVISRSMKTNNGSSLSSRETNSRRQSIGQARLSISFDQNSSPVIMKKMTTLLWPKWVARRVGGTVHTPVRAKIVVPVQFVPNLVAALQEHWRVFSESYTNVGWNKGPGPVH